MPSRDHSRIIGSIDCVDGDFRAFYSVSLGGGSHLSGVRRFADLNDARAWLEDEAEIHGAELVCEEQL